ncbi:alpha-tocopherol transfer protein-like [Bombyx mandarina]|uniref:Alpha-tocopherol transfer protein-like n=1 Tax=Bombyx mandarina TaxID=7092 RepID=A0A6J2KRU8_BOMMA|nr:alpha-tocopherol transfer protein-like [Bombyx mandarina]
MQIDYERDISLIREWLAKEDYLPQDLGDMLLKKFIHSCYGSLEKTKQCIDKFCVGRTNTPELYTFRDPTASKLKTAFSITSVTTYEAGEDEIVIHELDDPNLERFEFYDLLKTFAMQADYWLNNIPLFPRGHIVLIDAKHFYLKIVSRVNIFFFKQFLVYLLEAMPVRIKQIHVYNSPAYYDKLFSLVKPVLPQEICDMIKFHLEIEGLYAHVDKKYLPVELGGEAPSMKDQQKKWVKIITESRDMYLNDNLWKADMKKRAKSKGADTAMNGSFRSLSID